jgi:hypothetical protein
MPLCINHCFLLIFINKCEPVIQDILVESLQYCSYFIKIERTGELWSPRRGVCGHWEWIISFTCVQKLIGD